MLSRSHIWTESICEQERKQTKHINRKNNGKIMITIDQIRAMLLDIENDRVERTTSTTNTDKFGQAICAFANDLPDHRMPGYLFLGIMDDGTVQGVDVTDELLKNVAAIRTDGNIQPQPSMVVEKVSLPEGDIVMVEVQPHAFPPVRYKGRVWIRVGPRKGVASESDEHILLEKRAANIKTFDSTPCFDATIDDIDQQVFKHDYLPKAIPDDVNENDKRSIKEKMQALGFYDIKNDCPTYAGIIFFGKNPERFLGGAYVQYVRFGGNGRAGKIMTEHKFSGNLCKILDELDTFIKTTITNRRPIPVSALREEYFIDYPYWATRELVMNAICHRDYTGNGPVQFYQYDNHIEILNPGGLYGKANSQNFPRVNDYRNPVIAEGMRVLGYVNRYSWGVLEVQDRLEENGNGLPEFDLGLVTAFLVKENISPKGMQAKHNAIMQGYVVEENDQKLTSKTDIKNQKLTSRPEFPTILVRNVYELLKMNRMIKYAQMEDNLGVTERTIARAIEWLKENGYINPDKSKIKGEWQLL